MPRGRRGFVMIIGFDRHEDAVEAKEMLEQDRGMFDDSTEVIKVESVFIVATRTIDPFTDEVKFFPMTVELYRNLWERKSCRVREE
jgi:hypothetical protein